jgi:hypothetical protein
MRIFSILFIRFADYLGDQVSVVAQPVSTSIHDSFSFPLQKLSMRLRRSELNQSRWGRDFSFFRYSTILLLDDGDRILLDLLVVVYGATLV